MTSVVLHTTPAADTPCPRHGMHRWMAYCADCTAWHLGRQIAVRGAVGPTASVLTLVTGAARRPEPRLDPAA
ncbi:hypothetical protein ACI79G_21635 [Geodermatophilus sp. SYSU D00779]